MQLKAGRRHVQKNTPHSGGSALNAKISFALNASYFTFPNNIGAHSTVLDEI